MTFIKSGIISYPDGQLTLRLEDVNRYGLDISKTLDIDSGINLVPQDRYYNKKKRRFARLKNSSSAEISIIYDEFEDIV